MSNLADTSAHNGRCKCKPLATTSSASEIIIEDAINTPADNIMHAPTTAPNSTLCGKRIKLLAPVDTADVIVGPSEETWFLADTSRSDARRKWRLPSIDMSSSAGIIVDTVNVPPNGTSFRIRDDFPARFHVPSRHSVRRHLSTTTADIDSPQAPQSTPVPSAAHRHGPYNVSPNLKLDFKGGSDRNGLEGWFRQE